jgi:hypothetical protein
MRIRIIFFEFRIAKAPVRRLHRSLLREARLQVLRPRRGGPWSPGGTVPQLEWGPSARLGLPVEVSLRQAALMPHEPSSLRCAGCNRPKSASNHTCSLPFHRGDTRMLTVEPQLNTPQAHPKKAWEYA